MDQALPPEDDVPNGPLIDAGAGRALWLVRQIHHQLAQPARALGLAVLRRLFRHYLRPAEAALRRAIYLIANTLPPLPALKPRQPAHPRAGGGPDRQTPPQPCTPSFALTEREPRPSTNYLPLARRPCVSVPGLTPRPAPPVPRAAPDPARLEHRLRRRLAAFDAAFRDPVRAARRLLRRLARWTPGRLALAYHNIPGFTAKPLDAQARDTLQRLNDAIIAAFQRNADTS
ncbi:MAG: hypothetical protein FP825_13360 [Hyphomonas sp.]|uniref:hypothetical protein n=1 Tax=Hyphomonas sp. TaxID=87 RepID=UPI00181F9AA6|nr:hypothetical protein [Hyphomonas sp.]MBU3920033.1 hypothetical protein [Alphaproteobacteria bacterium]MBA3069453.1 hypothetical protein [Hyphomonas sp.]MBU4063835.1 hypothetical protein [Alphaproteobacteria bacterium]MBU4164204.1 hypothetical protein [Alphaproteobacteria bacterium]MBU4567363.1 hypothetical protein [Alphaproteobacteria bacterium]